MSLEKEIADFISLDEENYLEKYTDTFYTTIVQFCKDPHDADAPLQVEIVATFKDKFGFPIMVKFLTMPVLVYQSLSDAMLFRYMLCELREPAPSLAPAAAPALLPLRPPTFTVNCRHQL